MKDETRSNAATSHEPKHQFEHVPTVIHNPEEDMTLLAKWFKHNLEQGGKFWVWAGVGFLAVILGVLAYTTLSSSSDPAHNAWSELAVAQTPGQKLEVADEHPTSDAAQAARLQAATEFFSEASRDLPANRDAALPQLRKALDLFQQVAKDARPNSPEALAAAVGIARTLETRNELPDAVQQYKEIAKKWPNTPEAKEAERLAKALQDPEVIAFYKDLYAFKAPTATLPPGGTSNLSLPGLPTNHPDLNGPTMPAPGLPTLPPLPPPTSTTPPGGVTPGATAPPTGPGPLDIAPPPTPTPAPAPAKPATATKPAAPVMPATPPATPAKPATPPATPTTPAAKPATPPAAPTTPTPAKPATPPAATPKPATPPTLPSNPFAKPAAPK